MGKKKLLLLLLFSLTIISTNANALVPYDSYSYNYWKETVPAPPAYLPQKIIDSETLALDKDLNSPQDIFITDNKNIYLADTGNDRIIVINKNWRLEKIITSFDCNGKKELFNKPSGLFVTEKGFIYIADRENNRIVILDNNGEFVKEITILDLERKRVLGEDFVFRPQKVSVDRFGRIFVIAAGVYDGIMEFDYNNGFKGFVGAPKVNPSLADYIWKKIGTEEQRKRMVLFLPVEHSNFDIDKYGFIYATVVGDSAKDEEKIRRLNQAGDDILSRIGNTQPVGDYPGADQPQSNFIDVVVQENNVFSVLDSTCGRIFTYDTKGNLLYLFGGLGDQKGLFVTPVAVDNMGDKMLVLDSGKGRMTVFEATPYQTTIQQAIADYNNGRYDQSAKAWRRVLEYNSNNELAYSEIGRAYFLSHQYAEAMKYFKLGNDRFYYSKAFKNYRQEVIENNFLLIVLILIIIVFLIFYLTSRTQQLSKRVITETAVTLAERYVENDWLSRLKDLLKSLKFSLHVIFHPFDGFWDLKHEKRGNTKAALILLFFVSATYIIIRQYTGFIFNTRNVQNINIYTEVFSVLFPFGLWCVVNWSLTTLMDGKGNFRDIVIASSYALTPIIIINIPLTIVSNYLTIEEGAFYYFFFIFSIVWALILLFFASMVTHQYDLTKNILVSILIIIGIGITLFILLVFVNIIYELIGFFTNIYAELIFRL